MIAVPKRWVLLAAGLLASSPASAHDFSSLPYAIAAIVFVQAIPGLWVIGWKSRRETAIYFGVLALSWPLLLILASSFDSLAVWPVLLLPWLTFPVLLSWRSRRQQRDNLSET